MFRIKVWYDDNIVIEHVLDSVGTMCVNCGKNVGC